MHRRVTPAVPALLIATLLAACGGEDPSAGATEATPSAASSSASSSASPSAEPAPATETSQEEAARTYLDIVRPYNEALERWETTVNDGGSIEVVANAAADAALALETEATALRETAWPDDVAPHAAALADASAEASAIWSDMAAAESFDDVSAAVEALAAVDDAEAAAEIRRLLELDRYDEGDYKG